MKISTVVCEDLQDICSCPDIAWEELSESTFLITGGTGMMGGLLTRALLAADDRYCLGIKIILIVRDKKRAEAMFHDKRIIYYEQDIRDPLKITQEFHYAIHCASVTASKQMAADPVGTIETALDGTRNVLKEAKAHGIRSMVYVSSMEIYGSFPEITEVGEETLGFLDLSNPRSSYPEGKRMCECLCSSFFHQHNVPVKAARLAQVFGAGTSREDNRVYAQFAKSILRSEDIILHTEGKTIGNYCYTSDAVKGILLILLKGENGTAYNVSNETNTMTIRQMAELAAGRVAGGAVKCHVQIPEDIRALGYAPMANFKLKSDRLKGLGWKPRYSVPEMYGRMIKDWSEAE